MGSLFARPPARAPLDELPGFKVALDARAEASVGDVQAEGPVVVCLGAERAGLPEEVRAAADVEARVPLRPDGPDSLNVAAAGAIALYELARATSRMARDA
jgi:tRNA G18 (ribose-2'-O)-methylase SpoU